jgi:thymidylate synthase
MIQYHQLLLDVLNNGRIKSDRTGTGTISLFGTQSRYNLLNELPVLTTKKVALRAVIHELLWIISGSTNIKYLKDNNVKIWNEWADKNGDLGPVYGEMWRSFPSACVNSFSVDQLQNVIDEIKTNPISRRLIVSSWHPDLLPDVNYSPSENAYRGYQALPPCHTMFQFITIPMSLTERSDWCIKNNVKGLSLTDPKIPKYYLSCQLYQRSADLFLGVPFNITSYAILTYIVAKLTNTVPYEFIHTLGDAHIYTNHVDQVEELLSRVPYNNPTLSFSEKSKSYTGIDEFKFKDIIINNYKHHPIIKAPVAV